MLVVVMVGETSIQSIRKMRGRIKDPPLRQEYAGPDRVPGWSDQVLVKHKDPGGWRLFPCGPLTTTDDWPRSSILAVLPQIPERVVVYQWEVRQHKTPLLTTGRCGPGSTN